MKLFISADIEGVAGIAHWEEANPANPLYSRFADQMTREVAAVCEGAVAAGASDILVKDAHAGGAQHRPRGAAGASPPTEELAPPSLLHDVWA